MENNGLRQRILIVDDMPANINMISQNAGVLDSFFPSFLNRLPRWNRFIINAAIIRKNPIYATGVPGSCETESMEPLSSAS